MDQRVQIRRILVQLKEGLILQIFFTGLLHREQKSQALTHPLLVNVNPKCLVIQANHVDFVFDKLSVDLEQKLMTLKCAEPLNPCDSRLVWLLRESHAGHVTLLGVTHHLLLHQLRVHHINGGHVRGHAEELICKH